MENLRKLQLIELDIIKEFIRICQENNLKYYIIGGTVLGAVRHKGFIPWDDDIDVTMPRKDYEFFCKIAPVQMNQFYEIRTVDNSESHLAPFMKIIDKRGNMVISKALVESKQHAYIDVFPLDGLPNFKGIRFLHVRLFLIYRHFFLISVFKECVKQTTKRPIHENLIIWLYTHLNLQRFFNKKNRVHAGDRLLKKYRFPETKYCSPQLWGQYKTKAIFPTEWLGEGVKLPFEDIEVVVPSNYKQYLAQLYGADYMDMPPIEKRITHASRIIIKDEGNEGQNNEGAGH